MDATYSKILSELRFRKPVVIGSIHIIPVYETMPQIDIEQGQIQIMSLKKAIDGGFLNISETALSDGAISPLVGLNVSSNVVFGAIGEEIRGGRQNRVLSKSLTIKPNNTCSIPVRCSERDRWWNKDSNNKFLYANSVISPACRYSLLYSLLTERKIGQGVLWKLIDGYMAKSNCKPSTSAYCDLLNTDLRQAASLYKVSTHDAGLAAVYGDRVLGVDLISNSLLKDLAEPLIVSYLLHAKVLSQTGFFYEQVLSDWLARCSLTSQIKYRQMDLLAGFGIVGMGLKYERKIIHMCLLDATDSGYEQMLGNVSEPNNSSRIKHNILKKRGKGGTPAPIPV